VLVDIHAAGVNLLDAKIRHGDFKVFLPYKTPFTTSKAAEPRARSSSRWSDARRAV
jgi:hypothetical protein